MKSQASKPSPPSNVALEPATESPGQVPRAGVWSLYVTGQAGGTRHLLLSGLVRIGRGRDCTVVLDDPQASRTHALLDVGPTLALSDLGSGNGTLLGTERLASGEPRVIAEDQPFTIGDTILVVRRSGLLPPREDRLTRLDALRDRLLAGRHQLGTTAIAVRVRVVRATDLPATDAILSALLTSSTGYLVRTAANEVVLLTDSDSEPVDWERRTRRELLGWSVAAEVTAFGLGWDELLSPGMDVGERLARNVSERVGAREVVVASTSMIALKRHVQRVAPTEIPVLVLGETGVGKDVIASMLHEFSGRRDRPFVGINCATVPETLIESELFGYERGAFTGATSSKAGLFESADGGSFFLDEIGDLSGSLQAKLLRVLETREVMRLGAVRAHKVDVRVIAATNRDLRADVSSGAFREDLYYRLNGVTLRVPPLRDRHEDIEPLARLFLSRACARFQTRASTFSAAAVAALVEHEWPGNVRELLRVVERAALFADSDVLEPEHLALGSEDLLVDRDDIAVDSLPAGESERERIVQALTECGGNQTRVAERLGIPLRTLVRKLARLGVPRPRPSKR